MGQYGIFDGRGLAAVKIAARSLARIEIDQRGRAPLSWKGTAVTQCAAGGITHVMQQQVAEDRNRHAVAIRQLRHVAAAATAVAEDFEAAHGHVWLARFKSCDIGRDQPDHVGGDLLVRRDGAAPRRMREAVRLVRRAVAMWPGHKRRRQAEVERSRSSGLLQQVRACCLAAEAARDQSSAPISDHVGAAGKSVAVPVERIGKSKNGCFVDPVDRAASAQAWGDPRLKHDRIVRLLQPGLDNQSLAPKADCDPGFGGEPRQCRSLKLGAQQRMWAPIGSAAPHDQSARLEPAVVRLETGRATAGMAGIAGARIEQRAQPI
jgi:hypothetical protein